MWRGWEKLEYHYRTEPESARLQIFATYGLQVNEIKHDSVESGLPRTYYYSISSKEGESSIHSMDIRSKSDLEKLLEDLKKIIDWDNIVFSDGYLSNDVRNAWNNVEISIIPVDETYDNDFRA